MFLDKLLGASRRNQSLLCVGLDPDPRLAPPSLVGEPGWVARFARGIIDATADLVCAYKPNLAFYEALGAEGWDALRETVKAVPDGIPVIADAKRGDIGNTAQAYAAALYDGLGADAATVSPYLGQDSVAPFLAYRGRTAFVLCKTSNPGSGDFQDLVCQFEGRELPLYQVVAQRAVGWGAEGEVGLVVGATYPRELAAIRAIAPRAPLLLPGVGAQAGDLESAVRLGVDADGERAIVNASRQVLYASRGEDWQVAARAAALALRDAINQARSLPR